MTIESKRQIFVSYARSDEVFVTRLADDLSRSGAHVWVDVRNARPGRHWGRSIEQALGDSSMMLVVLSPDALEAAHVSVEWQAYLEAYRPVIPVLARPCDPPGPLRTRRPVDFIRENSYQRAFHQLMMRLLECGTRIRRNDPVIWTMSEHVIDFRQRSDPALPDGRAMYREPLPVRAPNGGEAIDRSRIADEFTAGGLRRMVQGLRDMLRRSPTSVM